MKFTINRAESVRFPSMTDPTVGRWYVSAEDRGLHAGYLHKNLSVTPFASDYLSSGIRYSGWYRTRQMARDTVKKYKEQNKP